MVRLTHALVTAAAAGLLTSSTMASTIVLTFEGLQSGESVENFYNGGTGSLGSSGPNVGVGFSPNTLASISSLQGGSGNFTNNPSGKTVMFFLSGSQSVMNIAAGFETGFSFYYSSISFAGSVTVFDGLNGSGSILATINLVPLGSNGTPGAAFDIWEPIGIGFAGVAKSVSFAGTDNRIGFDDITFGSDTPGAIIPLPSAGLLAMGGMLVVAGRRRTRSQDCH